MQALAPLTDYPPSQNERQTMVDCQIRTFDVTDQRLLARFLAVPRELFVPDDMRALAYSDIGFVIPAPSSVDETRYLLPPMILARLIQGGRVKADDRVLDVACGFGYSTAVLAGLAGRVTALEATDGLCRALKARLSAFGIDDIGVVTGDLAAGAPSDEPFDLILINGAADTNLDTLFGQLADGGRLLSVRRNPDAPPNASGRAVCYEKRGGEIGTRFLFDAAVPVLSAFRKTPAFVF